MSSGEGHMGNVGLYIPPLIALAIPGVYFASTTPANPTTPAATTIVINAIATVVSMVFNTAIAAPKKLPKACIAASGGRQISWNIIVDRQPGLFGIIRHRMFGI